MYPESIIRSNTQKDHTSGVISLDVVFLFYPLEDDSDNGF